MSFFQEFKSFAMRGSVIDMAVGIIIGAAFKDIATSLVDNVLMPPIGLLIGGVDFSEFSFVLRAATESTDAVTIQYGVFINTIINFVLIALAVFLMIKQINRFQKKEEKKQAAKTSEEVELLREIRDALKKKKA